MIKEKAWLTDFELPLTPKSTATYSHSTQLATISSLVGEQQVAFGYNRVIADGESLWLEISEKLLLKKNFTKRQTTASRQYWTLMGVTIHQQLQLEYGKAPRRHKLAVNIPRGEPSSRLEVGKWYVHAHQVKVGICVNAKVVWKKLRTNRLITLLRRTFGQNYHPRTSAWIQNCSTNIQHSRRGPRRSAAKDIIPNKFPMPMKAPPPWKSPAWYRRQVPQNAHLDNRNKYAVRNNQS